MMPFDRPGLQGKRNGTRFREWTRDSCSDIVVCKGLSRKPLELRPDQISRSSTSNTYSIPDR